MFGLGLKFWVCVFAGFAKSVRSRGRTQNLAIELRAHMSLAGLLYRDRGTLVINATKINFAIT